MYYNHHDTICTIFLQEIIQYSLFTHLSFEIMTTRDLIRIANVDARERAIDLDTQLLWQYCYIRPGMNEETRVLWDQHTSWDRSRVGRRIGMMQSLGANKYNFIIFSACRVD